MPQDAQVASSYEGLRAIIARLRAPDGCPWDREQTHASLRRNLLEESYEALEALDTSDTQGLAEELGDILVQVVFHCQIARESGEFTDEDVFRGVVEKLVRRHPHVFGEASARDAREVEEQWQAIKERERGDERSALDGVPTSTPALAYAQAISHRAARAGFEWDDVDDAIGKVAEELGELADAETDEEREQEFGDLLLSIVNVGRWLGLDAESALRKANRRFYGRFAHMERTAHERGDAFANLSLEAKEALWRGAKQAERGGGEVSKGDALFRLWRDQHRIWHS